MRQTGRRRRLSVLGAVILGGLDTQAASAPVKPPAGEYGCWKRSPEYDPGLQMTIRYPRPNRTLGRVVLDGKGSYRLTGGSQSGQGKYSFNTQSGAFQFTSGPMTVYPTRFEVEKQGYVLQFLDVKTREDSAFWCLLEGQGTVTAPPGNTTGPGGKTATTARAVNPGLKGTLLFSFDLRIIALDLATGQTQNRLSGSDLSVSRDGTVAYLNTQSNIAFANARFEPQGVLASLEQDTHISQLALSPDGQRVAYTTQDLYKPGVIVRSRAGQVLAYLERRASPAWTPDGRLLVAAQKGDPAGLWVSTPDLKTWRSIPLKVDDLRVARMSPDGKRLAFVSGGTVWLMNADGSSPRALGSDDGSAYDVVWAPDGQSLIFEGQRGALLGLSLKGEVRRVLNAKGDPVSTGSNYVWR